jgi:tetratricopeptide (TPR) repeat protein
MVDPAVFNELRTLPEGLAERVARHLAYADELAAQGDISGSREHIAAAKRRAGRVAVVREAAGIAAYLDGEYAEALSDLRAVRRMNGATEFVPMMADCERGLGRPKRALDLLREIDLRTLDAETRVEALLVMAGARADLGQIDAAVLTLQVPELTKLPKGSVRARLQFAYSDFLEQADRHEESLQWLRKAAESDVDGVTEAGAMLDDDLGLEFDEEDFDEEERGDDAEA